jgi:uncharacterized protein (DUF924 family)
MDIIATEIIDFWFSADISKQWFNAKPALDSEIKSKYEILWQAASRGEFDHWQDSADGALALVIILDQFPLNMYRNQAKSFITEARSIEVAHQAVERGFDQSLPAVQRAFLYMPFMHSEKLSDQALSVKLFTEAGLKDNQHFAEHHRDLIKRFGRFPHRNEILGRQSSSEELEYLNSKEAFTG